LYDFFKAEDFFKKKNTKAEDFLKKKSSAFVFFKQVFFPFQNKPLFRAV